MAVNKPGWVNTVAEYAMTATALIIAKSTSYCKLFLLSLIQRNQGFHHLLLVNVSFSQIPRNLSQSLLQKFIPGGWFHCAKQLYQQVKLLVC